MTGFKKASSREISFQMVDETDFSTPETGLTVVVQIAKDGGSFGNADNTPATEMANGWYKITLNDAELNADMINVKATSAGAAQQNLVFYTEKFAHNDIIYAVESRFGHHTISGNVYYVDPVNGDTFANGNTGTRDSPLSLVQDCVDNLVTDSNHDVIILVAGAAGTTTLTEDVDIDKRYVFIRGPGRDFVWTRTGAGNTITVTADGCMLSGFQVETANSGSGNGIDVSGADFVMIDNVWANDTRGDAFNFSNSSNFVITNNNLQGSGTSGAGNGIVIDGAGGSSDFGVIMNNTCAEVVGDGIKLTGNIQNTRVQNNTSYANTGWGININGGNDAVVTNNKLGNNGSGNLVDNGTDTVDIDNGDGVAEAVWDLATSGHTTAGTFGEQCKTDIDSILSTVLGFSIPTAAAIADAVWDEALSGHVASGTMGELMTKLKSTNFEHWRRTFSYDSSGRVSTITLVFDDSSDFSSVLETYTITFTYNSDDTILTQTVVRS